MIERERERERERLKLTTWGLPEPKISVFIQSANLHSVLCFFFLYTIFVLSTFYRHFISLNVHNVSYFVHLREMVAACDVGRKRRSRERERERERAKI